MDSRRFLSARNASVIQNADSTVQIGKHVWNDYQSTSVKQTDPPERRSVAENKLLHALISHIAQHHEWAGKKRSVDVWKRLLTYSWCRARGESVEMLPALDGNGFDIVYRKTSRLTVSECAELLEYIQAWAAEFGVQFPADPRQVESIGETK